MASDRKYYYLKLKDNYFESDEIKLLESMADGYLYSNILLKLYLKSLKNEGKLIFNNTIPYNANMLATITNHQIGTVEKAIKIFKELGLLEILDNGAIYMLQIQNFIGHSSTEADRKREYRNRIESERKGKLCLENNKKDKCPDKCPTEIEKELELELELETEIEIEKEKNIYTKKENTANQQETTESTNDTIHNFYDSSKNNSSSKKQKQVKHKYGEYKQVLLTDEQYNKLKNEYSNYEELIKELDEAIEMKGYKYKNCYLAIKKWVVDAVKSKKKKSSIFADGVNTYRSGENYDVQYTEIKINPQDIDPDDVPFK